MTFLDLLQLPLEPPLTLDEINTTMMILPAVVEAEAAEIVVVAVSTKMQIEDLEAVLKREWVSLVFQLTSYTHTSFQKYSFKMFFAYRSSEIRLAQLQREFPLDAQL